jgi:hypothetical protein
MVLAGDAALESIGVQVEHIQKVTGLDHMMCMQQFWSIPHDKVMKSIRSFGKHVIPHFVRQKGRGSVPLIVLLEQRP